MRRISGVVLVALTAAACGDAGVEEDAERPATEPPAVMADEAERSVTVELEPTDGSEVRGTVELTEVAGGVRVSARVRGLSAGDHGFHIHETGDCSAPDAGSAGGHFGPEGSGHGGPDERPPRAHVGDMGNLTAGSDGTATYDRTFQDMAFQGEHGILGRAIVVHAEADDLDTDPSGAAGDRMACGVIPAGV